MVQVPTFPGSLKVSVLIRPVIAMPTLAQQLRAFNKSQKEQISKEVVKTMTLAELANEKITFGESKKGMTYAKAFEDVQWTEFIVNRFENSDKPEHMMYVQYVRLRLESMPSSTKGDKTGIKEKEKKEMPPVPQEVWEELMPVDCTEASDLMNMPLVMDEMQDLRQSNQNLSNRMSQVETMMQEMLTYMRNMQVKTEDSKN